MRSYIILFFALLILFNSVFVQAGIQSSVKAGTVKNNFSTTEAVYAKITADTCSPLPSAKLYVVENKDDWKEGDDLVDERENVTQEITLGKQQVVEIWLTPRVGDYDIILDCAKEFGKYEPLDPIDTLNGSGFTVTAVVGAGKVELGKNNIGNHSWQYDPESVNLINEMLQLNLLAEGEDMELSNITIQASGTGNDVEIEKVEIYVDGNNNGKLDEDEYVIENFSYPEDNSKVTIPLSYYLSRNVAENILIVYTMKQTTPKGEYALKVHSIYSIGIDSGEIIKFSGLPLDSGTKIVLPEKTCIGNLNLSLEPNPTNKNSKVVAKISGVSGCANKTISLRKNPCGSSLKEEVSSCEVKDGGCEVTFTAIKSEPLYACIDKNGDGDMVDIGEFAFGDLVILAEKIEEKIENVTGEVNVTETEEEATKEEAEEVGKITGGLAGLGEELTKVGSFFILLEVTLLLILFVLIMILFKLRIPAKLERARKDEED